MSLIPGDTGTPSSFPDGFQVGGNGSPATPAFTFLSPSNNTGMYSPGDDQIAFSSNGVRSLLVGSSGSFTAGPESGSVQVSHTIYGYSNLLTWGNGTLNLSNRNGSNAVTIVMANSTTKFASWSSSNTFPWSVQDSSGNDLGYMSSSGAWTLGPSSGSGLIHKLISNSKLLIGDTGTMEFRDRADTVTLGSVHTTTGAWTFGTSSETTEFGHSMTGYRTTATTSVLYIRNRETTTASDDAYDIICNKGSTTNTSSQGFIAFYVNDGGTPSGHITANGAGAATFNAFSDLRLKENIQPLQGELLKILSLNPVEFDYKDGSGHQIGFIAQEVEQVYPDTINVLGETEKMKTIAGWDKTSARLVKAIQELKAELDVAKAQIQTLLNP